MSDHQLYWLLAQAYIAQRLGYLTTIIAPVHLAIRDALDATGRLPRPADNCTDSEVREAFRPGNEQGEPTRKAGGPVAPGGVKENLDYLLARSKSVVPGPELFVPGVSGRVVPNYTTGSNPNVEINVAHFILHEDGEVTADPAYTTTSGAYETNIDTTNLPAATDEDAPPPSSDEIDEADASYNIGGDKTQDRSTIAYSRKKKGK